MRTGVYSHVALGTGDVALLQKVASDLAILADLSRADLCLFCRAPKERAIAVAQARPHSSSPLYEEDRIGEYVTEADHPEVIVGLRGNLHPYRIHAIDVRHISVARQVFPVWNERGRLIAVVAKDAYWLSHERHKRRSLVFQEALSDFTAYVLRSELIGGGTLSPFGEHDGIMFVGSDQRVQYMSGIASELFRQLGYPDSLLGRRVTEIETVDRVLALQAMETRQCTEVRAEHKGLTWVRKALPIVAPQRPFFVPRRLVRWQRPQGERASRVVGAFVLFQDITEALRTQRELESKMAMIREVHHRVKNNLQIVASIMRMQARRTQSAEARSVLEEAVGRVMSVAVVHEFLSQNAQGLINLEEVAHRIIAQTRSGLIGPEQHVELTVEGPDIWLPAERATQCALVINELVQNAIEHGMAGRERGVVKTSLSDLGDSVEITVVDDGAGLPEGFSLEPNANLGLRIVQSIVSRDLNGTLELHSDAGSGTRAVMRFNKLVRV